jgi:hypothetical protein
MPGRALDQSGIWELVQICYKCIVSEKNKVLSSKLTSDTNVLSIKVAMESFYRAPNYDIL